MPSPHKTPRRSQAQRSRRGLFTEQLERRDLLASIQLLAAGVRNDEQIQLLINDALVATFDNVGGDAYAGQFVSLEATRPGIVTADEVKVVFTNDLYDEANNIDRNVRVDALLIDGIRYETEGANVFSTGTWKPEDGIVAGFRESEFLHTDGYFQYASLTNTGSLVEVRVRGEDGTEQFDLRLDNITVASFAASTTYQTFVYRAASTIDPSQLRVYFTNDTYEPALGIDSNLYVDYLSIDGVKFETEAPNVFSTGTWKPEDGIQPGFRQSEVLNTNGYFHYDQELKPGVISLQSSVLSFSEGDAVAVISVLRSNGSDGRVTVDYRTVALTATATVDFTEQIGTLVFEDGDTLATITIPLIDDSIVESNEQFSFAIDNVVGASLLAPRTATVTIFDNDSIQATGDGLLGEYFDGPAFTERFLNRVDSTINFDWGTAAPATGMGADTFTVRWTGQIEPRYSELYTFETRTDDGVRLWVDGELIIDQWIDQAATNHTGTLELNAGQLVDIRMEYYERTGSAVARLRWSSASQATQVVPRSQLYAADPPPPTPGSELETQTLVTGLVQPTSLDFSPDGTLMYIAEQRGIVRVVENGVLKPSPFLDFRDRVNGTRDRGLLDIAIHPDFENQPYFYLLYTYDPPEVNSQSAGTLAGPDGRGNRTGRLTRVTADAATGFTSIVSGSEVVLVGRNGTWDNFNAFANSTINFDEPPAGILPDGSNLQDFIATDSESHTVGSIEFGLDGNLFATIGDGTSYNRVDPRTVRVQDIDNLSGKVLRIDPITGRGLADNPFYNGDGTSNRSKVYQSGVRNAFRSAVHPDDGRLFVGDVGWTQWEEINVGAPGANFGWPFYEGGNGNSLRTNGYQTLPEAAAFYASGVIVDPALYALNHSQSGINAIVLGDFYSGSAYPEEYRGDLFFNDLGQGIVRNINFNSDGTVASVDTFATGAQIVVQIKQGPDDNLYFVDLDNGSVGRWVFAEDSSATVAAKSSPGTPVSGGAHAADATGILIATIDSGLNLDNWSGELWTNTHEIPGDGIDNDRNGWIDDVHGFDFVDFDSQPHDESGHGTFIATLLASDGRGLAQNATLMSLRAFDLNGNGSAASIAEAIRYAATNGAQVIVMPFETGKSEAIRSAVEFASERGAVIVAAAGNGFQDEPAYIAALSGQFGNVISAGAISDSAARLPESNLVGSSAAMQIDAPGVSMGLIGDSHVTYRGTSVSTAIVAAVAAQVLAANPTLTAEQVRDVILSTVKPSASGSDSLGTLDSYAARELSQLSSQVVFRQNGQRMNITGTDSDDAIEFAFDTRLLLINGIEYTQIATAGINTVVFSGGAGMDRITIQGSAGDESAVTRPGFARITSSEFSFTASALEHVRMSSGGGIDRVVVQGSIGDDSIAVSDNVLNLWAGESSLLVTSFADIQIDGVSGNDQMTIADTINRDRFVFRPGSLQWQSPSFKLGALRVANAFITASSNDDTAIVYGGSGVDSYFASTSEIIATGHGYMLQLLDFPRVILQGNGDEDAVVFSGSEEDERYYADSRQARFSNNSCFVTARGISNRIVEGGGGLDRAIIHDSSNDDTLRINADLIDLQSDGRSDVLGGFEYLYANSLRDDGNDVIQILAAPEFKFTSAGDWQQGAPSASFSGGGAAEESSNEGNQALDTLFDVNGDGITSPLDALLIVNSMHRDSDSANSTDLLFDVSGDGIVSALDVLLVIDHLNKRES